MALRVCRSSCGRDAAASLAAAIADAKGGEALAPVTVVVPSNHVAVSVRRLLGSGTLGPLSSGGSGYGAVSFLTAYRLAELLGAPRLAGSGRRPVSTPVLAAALRAALAEDPGVFAEVADHEATESALVTAYRELRDCSDGALERLAGCGPRAADVVRLQRRARAILQQDFYDEEDLIESAVAVLSAGERPLDVLGRAVVAYLPQRVSRHACSLLAAVAARRELLVVAGLTGDERADQGLERTLSRLRAAAGEQPADHVAAAQLAPPVSPARTRIVTTSDADEEARAAVRAVVDAARQGVPLERTAILFPHAEPYSRLVHDHLLGAGIAHNGAAVAPPAARVAGRTLLGLFELAAGGLRRDDVFAFLSGAPVRFENRRVPLSAWERASREAGVVAGRREWDERLERYAASCDAEAERVEADPDGPAWLAYRRRREAESARSLRGFVLGLADDLAGEAAQARSWAERAGWARHRLGDLLGPESARRRWPPVEVKAAERVEAAIDRLEALSGVEGPVSLPVFERTLRVELESDLGRVGRIGEGVFAGPLSMGVGLDLDLVVVLGMAEGLLPARVAEDSLLPDHERRATGGELELRAERVERQHYELLASLAGAKRHVLCMARGDLRRSSELVPSRFLCELAGALGGRRYSGDELLAADEGWIEHVPSFDGGLRRLAVPASEQEYRLRAALARPAGEPARRALVALGDPALSASTGVVVARRSDSFTRFDGNLGGLSIPSVLEAPVSPTRLESWARCPFAYLVASLLHVEEVENPEDRLTISPLDLGSLVHEVLERFVAEALVRPSGVPPVPGAPWSPADRARLEEIAGEVCARFESEGRVGRALFWQRARRRLFADLARLLDDDDARRAATGALPIAAELAFGLPGSPLGPVALPLRDGRTLFLRGKADRVDRRADGGLEVLDYKTGHSTDYRSLSEADPDLRGQKLQLAIYGLAARLLPGGKEVAVRAEYWFTSGSAGGQRIGYAVTDEVVARVAATVGRIVAGIEAGVFVPHPGPPSTSPYVECAYCDPDGLGSSELRRLLERKRHYPALRDYLELAGEIEAEAAALEAELDPAGVVP